MPPGVLLMRMEGWRRDQSSPPLLSVPICWGLLGSFLAWLTPRCRGLHRLEPQTLTDTVGIEKKAVSLIFECCVALGKSLDISGLSALMFEWEFAVHLY